MYKAARDVHHFNGVCVGHHHGDVQENVLANLFKGRSLLELHGMSQTCTSNGVNIWRPLLPHNKVAVWLSGCVEGCDRMRCLHLLTNTVCRTSRTRLRAGAPEARHEAV